LPLREKEATLPAWGVNHVFSGGMPLQLALLAATGLTGYDETFRKQGSHLGEHKAINVHKKYIS
jgi:hypothetical protein